VIGQAGNWQMEILEMGNMGWNFGKGVWRVIYLEERLGR
jgi:hypothetical protein